MKTIIYVLFLFDPMDNFIGYQGFWRREECFQQAAARQEKHAGHTVFCRTMELRRTDEPDPRVCHDGVEFNDACIDRLSRASTTHCLAKAPDGSWRWVGRGSPRACR